MAGYLSEKGTKGKDKGETEVKSKKVCERSKYWRNRCGGNF